MQHDGVVETNSTSLQSTTSIDSSQTQVCVKNRIPIFPDFLHPGIYEEHLTTFKRSMAEAIPTRKFTPLMPQQIARRLIENSFAEIMAEHQLMDLPNFVILLDAQYAASSRDPADNPARWAVFNAIVALAVRFKTAPGSEAAVYDITHGFYQNATRVLPELLLQDPCLLSIQALLAMAMFARNIPDIPAFIMLATNASRQLELLSLSGLSTDRLIHMEGTEQYEQVYRTINIFDKTILEFLGTEVGQGTSLT
jgi:hypothetical protein